MAGGLLNLVAYGNQNVILNLDQKINQKLVLNIIKLKKIKNFKNNI